MAQTEIRLKPTGGRRGGQYCADDVWSAYPPIKTRAGYPVAQIAAAKRKADRFALAKVAFGAAWIFQHSAIARERWDGVIPMPTQRALTTEFVDLFAQAISAWTNQRGQVAAWLALTAAYDTQKEQVGDRARRCNVVGAFSATRRLQGMRLILVDDVATSGATLSAGSVALFDAGAKVVQPAVIYCALGRTRLDLAPKC